MNDDFSKGLKIATFDIETTGLEAQHGYMLCACIKEVNPKDTKGKTWTYRIDDYPLGRAAFSDKALVQDTIKKLNEFDVIVGWYSSRFDFPFLITRAFKHGLALPRKEFRRDLCLSARGFSKLKNNRLYNWERYLFGKTHKTFLDFQVWIEAIRGRRDAINEIVYHCQKDVLSTELIYKKFNPILGKLRRN